jgi:hypothetical protein
MKLFELFAELSLDSGNFDRGIKSASKQGATLASTLSTGFRGISARTIAMGHALYDFGRMATRVAADFGKTVISEYADAEQLVGGIETLFGASADMVIKNAQQAYRTAGLSANQYMETVTSFSASLLQSLGGDTAAAARVSDMAVQDMSDNANKMGTDMGMIMNAYQGFAKQNYTMLDNLKLGYGGTRTEMERLLRDAEAIQRAQGKNVRYSINNLDDVYEAIHVIQTEMGITGTTAEEAAKTIWGSFNAFKASWKNLLAGFGTDEDMEALVDNLYETGETLISNVMGIVPKMGERALQGVDRFLMRYDLYRTLRHAYDQGGWQAVADAGTAMFKHSFTNFWNNTLPGIVKDGANGVIGIINSVFGTNIPAIESIKLPTWEEITTTVTTWWTSIRGQLESAAQWTLKLFNNPTAAADDVKSAFETWWINTARPSIESACEWTLSLFSGVAGDESSIKKLVSEWWNDAGKLVGSVTTFVASLVGFTDGTAEAAGTTIEQWWSTIGAGFGKVCTFFATLVTPDEEDTKAAVKDLYKWFYTDFLGALGDSLVVRGKVVFELADNAFAALMNHIESQWKAGLTAIGMGWLFDENESQLEFKNQMEANQAATAWENNPMRLAGKYANVDPMLRDTMEAYAHAWISGSGQQPSWWSLDESDFNINDQGMMDQWRGFLADLNAFGDELNMDNFWSWFEEPEGETEEESDVSSSLEQLNTTVSAFAAAAEALPGQAAAAAASALSGAKVEMDGAAVGQIVLAPVMAEISRMNRTAARAFA